MLQAPEWVSHIHYLYNPSRHRFPCWPAAVGEQQGRFPIYESLRPVPSVGCDGFRTFALFSPSTLYSSFTSSHSSWPLPAAVGEQQVIFPIYEPTRLIHQWGVTAFVPSRSSHPSHSSHLATSSHTPRGRLCAGRFPINSVVKERKANTGFGRCGKCTLVYHTFPFLSRLFPATPPRIVGFSRELRTEFVGSVKRIVDRVGFRSQGAACCLDTVCCASVFGLRNRPPHAPPP